MYTASWFSFLILLFRARINIINSGFTPIQIIIIPRWCAYILLSQTMIITYYILCGARGVCPTVFSHGILLTLISGIIHDGCVLFIFHPIHFAANADGGG